MRDYRWFKILVRAIGVLLAGMSISYLTSAAMYLLDGLQIGARGGTYSYWPRAAAYGIGGGSQLLLGLYLLSGAPKFVRYCIDQVDRRCIRCDYDLSGLKGTCPECGLPIPEAGSAPTP